MADTEYGLTGRFLRGLAAAADRTAVPAAGGAGLTYRALHERALRQGAALAATGSPAVGVLAAKGATAYTGLLAALYAGAAVVPLRPDFPPVRTAQMIDAAGVRAIVADEAGMAVADQILAGREDVTVLDARADDPAAAALGEPAHVKPADPAYVLFTSGSTGRPKGVVITHASLTHYFDLLAARYDFTAADVFSQTFDLNFDCSVFDLFCAWGAGARVVAPSAHAYRDLPRFVAESGVTVWFSTPSAIDLVRRMGGLAPSALAGLRWSFFAGEALQHRDAADWQRATGGIVENLYGPTELTITVAAHRWSPDGPEVNGVVPIGAVHDGHEHLLLGDDGEPTDTEGELCIAGPQLTPGYLDPADDAGRFFDRGAARFYRTGDRVRVLPGGGLGYLGRRDNQVQVQGWRVELAEVENMLRGCGVHDAVVVGVPAAGGTALVAFYTGDPVPASDLARALRAVLPAGVIPKRFEHLEQFPLNGNRKVDRGALTTRALAP